jgi:hypothetical protein
MNAHLRDRILRKLEALNDERGYQVLDYVEFLESKFAERQTPTANAFTRFSEAVEDRLRAGKISASAIAETMGLLNRAANVLNGAVAAGKSVATDIYSAAQTATSTRASSSPSGTTSAQTGPTSATSGSPPAAQPQQEQGTPTPARDVPEPGSAAGEERL